MKVHTIMVVGLGGTGSHLWEPLVRYSTFEKEMGTTHFVIADGDIFEEGNATRQLFPPEFEGTNKATAMKAKVSGFCPDVKAITQILDKNSALAEMREAPLWYKEMAGLDKVPDDYLFCLISAVDNSASRVAFLEALDEAVAEGRFKNYLLIDPGNDVVHGGVAMHLVLDGQKMTTDPRERYGNYAKPEDVIPMGCAKIVASSPQHIIANAFAAVMTLNALRIFMKDGVWFDHINFWADGSGKGGKVFMSGVGQGLSLKEEPVAPLGETIAQVEVTVPAAEITVEKVVAPPAELSSEIILAAPVGKEREVVPTV